MEEISRASGAVGLSYGAHSNLCVNQLARFGTDAQKQAYLPSLISGEFVGALARANTIRVPMWSAWACGPSNSDDYILNGGKMWITGPQADVLVVCTTVDPSLGSKASSVPDRKVTGSFGTGTKLDKLGMRGSILQN